MNFIDFLKSKFGSAPPPVGIDAREAFFPDWALRRESDELSAAFDPFNLQLSPGLDEDIAPESLALMVGDLDQARRIARPKLSFMSPSERVPYMLQVTQGVHELRHFHDHFGTTAGFSRVVRTVRDAMEFHMLWEELQKLGSVKLPLAAWARHPDAPTALRDYASKRRTFVEWFNLHDGLELPTGPYFEDIQHDEAIVLIRMKDLDAVLPYIPLNYFSASFGESADGRHGRILTSGDRSQRVVPLGCSLLMEGAAYTVQRAIAGWLFGGDAGDEFHSWILRRAPSDIGPYRYTAVDIFLTRKFDRFYDRYQLALTDAALMPAPHQNKPEDHPGMRLLELAKNAATGPPRHLDPKYDLASWVSRLSHKSRWPDPARAARRATAEWKLHRGEAQDESFWARVFEAFLSLHVDFLARRIKTPNLLADPSVWFSNLGSLPPPPIFRNRGELAFLGTPSQVEAFRAWFMFEHFQRHVMFGTTLPCAGHGHPHKCPGDPMAVRKWVPLDSCPFSKFIVSLGMSDLKIERLRG